MWSIWNYLWHHTFDSIGWTAAIKMTIIIKNNSQKCVHTLNYIGRLTWYFTVPQHNYHQQTVRQQRLFYGVFKIVEIEPQLELIGQRISIHLNENMNAFRMDPKQLWKLFNLSTDKNKWVNGFISCLFFMRSCNFHTKYVHRTFSTFVSIQITSTYASFQFSTQNNTLIRATKACDL